MAEPTYRGTTAPVIEEQEIVSDANRGTIINTRTTGISAQAMIALRNQYYFAGVDTRFVTKGGMLELLCRDATQYNPTDNWELIGDTERKDLFQNPNWGTELEVLGGPLEEDEMAAIRYYLENNTPAHAQAGGTPGAFDAPAAGSVAALQYPSLEAFSGTLIERAYSRYQAGNDEFENDAYGGGYTLKHTTNIPNRYTVNIADFNVGSIYSTANLLSEISNTSLWVLPAPPRLLYKINLLGIDSPPSATGYFWGWKKGRSTEDTAANNRVNITQHYTLELWNTDDYPTFA
jgi:hypothetical protein